jgi:hypothetical protein
VSKILTKLELKKIMDTQSVSDAEIVTIHPNTEVLTCQLDFGQKKVVSVNFTLTLSPD